MLIYQIVALFSLRYFASAKTTDKRLNESLPADLLDQLFTLKNAGEATKATNYSNGFIIARLEEKLPAPKADSEEGKRLMDALKRSMEEEHNNEVLDEFTKQLHARFPVEINVSVLETLTKSGQTADVLDPLMQGGSTPSTPPQGTKKP